MAKEKAAANAATDNWDEEAPQEARVKIKCVVHTRPGTGGHENPDSLEAHRPMAHGEVREVPESVAKLMVKAKQVRIVKDGEVDEEDA